MRTEAGAARVASRIPPFEPHPLLRNPHWQTLAGRYFPGRGGALPSVYHEVRMPDGDRLTLLDARPVGWRPGCPVVLFVHGLGGCARASYVTRVAARLHEAGARTVRMNLRGAGAGFGLARGIYHSGRTEDARAVADWAMARSPGSPLGLVGFSLGANLVLKLAAEAVESPLPGLDCVVAANPPLDLSACCRLIREPKNRIYDGNFVAGLKRQIARLHRTFPELGTPQLDDVRTLYDFDDRYTAPRNGFHGAEDYYAKSSAGPLVGRISVAGLVVHAADDPFIPVETVRDARFPEQVCVRIETHGGHLGFLSKEPCEGGHRWLDACITRWLCARWRLG